MDKEDEVNYRRSLNDMEAVDDVEVEVNLDTATPSPNDAYYRRYLNDKDATN